ncbi:hypothetical protein JD276_12925 [Leucobacter sp. CSA1]|uniref:Uncharacterized protein n=1 Tax=Leucobacter chromiisoli TaxID=2796471 RepID=A0A934QB48_9MICO|nr:hypothetical protein [Leucobacter chromiisoli]MBK0419934.1 hypothetical protein [Leucobacter chromiisoli]
MMAKKYDTQRPPSRDEERRGKDPSQPTAEAPDSVEESVPEAVEDAGKVGPDAADPPRAGSDRDDRKN